MLNENVHLDADCLTDHAQQVPTRDGFGQALLELGQKDKNVIVITGDLEDSTRVIKFHQQFPDQFIEAGVAEQNMMGIAAGLAVNGKIPFLSSYAVFSPGRSWDQARVSVGYTNANVKVAGAHTGISVGPDGATHQALEDIAIMRVLPNFVVVAPCDSIETAKATRALYRHAGPAYFRFGREKTPVMTTESTPFKLGQAYPMWLSKAGQKPDVAIVGIGPLLHEALKAAQELEKIGLESVVINSHTVKPLDVETIVGWATKAGAVVTVEEHQINGGLGDAVATALAENQPTPMERIGMGDTFGESGAPIELLDKYKMTSRWIVQAVKTVLKRKKKN